ncbi:RTA1 like protein-domain-containing protein [Thelonectria olida]|uniref:RTA1 like protein-domain-containing protein n=1 Tax=Thelonectria olida TaxID=1576542 RepID=A0A9P9ALC4_9HYPO|nr:RTA1 like protein-domain-containing protein [Thelonectria olida]
MGLVHFEDGKVLYYPYTPSKSAGYAFMALFAITTCAHLAHSKRFKNWFFIPMMLGGICETFGHLGRAWAGTLPDSPRPFMLQLMLILVSPVFIAATIYVTLGKFKQSVLGRPKRKCSVTSVFVVTDVIAFCTQIGGGLVQVTGNLKIMKIGDRVVLGGLLFQLGVLAIYLFLVFRFYQEAQNQTAAESPCWRPYVCILVISVVAIWIRNLVRAIEYAQGFHGFISEHEAMLYVFDSFLMLLIMILFFPLHYSRAVQRLKDPRWQPLEMNGR